MAWFPYGTYSLGRWWQRKRQRQAKQGGPIGELALVDQLAEDRDRHPLDLGGLGGVGRRALVGGAVGPVEGETEVADARQGEVAAQLGQGAWRPTGLLLDLTPGGGLRLFAQL